MYIHAFICITTNDQDHSECLGQLRDLARQPGSDVLLRALAAAGPPVPLSVRLIGLCCVGVGIHSWPRDRLVG